MGCPPTPIINDALAALAHDHKLPVVATNNVHFATPDGGRLGAAMAAVRARRSLAEMDGWLSGPGAYLRSGSGDGADLRALPRRGGAVGRDRRRVRLRPAAGQAAAAQAAGPRWSHPDQLAAGADAGEVRTSATRTSASIAEERLQQELAVIEEKDFPGYFLIVHDMVEFARESGILCQGRGSAANSVVCYVLGITAVDPIRYELPFERFLSATRDEEPDIDVDFDSDRREEVIQ